MQNLLISVIVPVYNTEKYLPECLDSAINQTYRNIEIICVDDGSTDGSLEILKEYSEKDNRIIIMECNHQGVAVARNIALKNATGDYVIFLDSDDYLTDDAIEKCVAKTQEYDLDIVYFGQCDYKVGRLITWPIRKLRGLFKRF